LREDQSVAEMANEVLMRQAKVRAERRGEPIEEAMEAVEETQVDAARKRAKGRAEELGRGLGETPGHPAHG
jgi:hypothetical protein